MSKNDRSLRVRRRQHGFTLLELLVVITIIGILSSIVYVSTRGAGPQARRAEAKAEMQSIYNTAMALYTHSGQWPESIEVMVNATDENGLPAIASLDQYPTDPWKNDYEFVVSDDGTSAYVRCLGSDNTEGGEGEAQDLYWPPQDEGTQW